MPEQCNAPLNITTRKETQRKLEGNLKETQRKLKGNLKETQRKLEVNSKETQRKLKGNSKETQWEPKYQKFCEINASLWQFYSCSS